MTDREIQRLQQWAELEARRLGLVAEAQSVEAAQSRMPGITHTVREAGEVAVELDDGRTMIVKLAAGRVSGYFVVVARLSTVAE